MHIEDQMHIDNAQQAIEIEDELSVSTLSTKIEEDELLASIATRHILKEKTAKLWANTCPFIKHN